MSEYILKSFVSISPWKLNINGKTEKYEAESFKEFSRMIYGRLGVNYPKFYKMDNLCMLSYLGSEILLSGDDIFRRHCAEKIGLFFSTSSSSIDSDRKFYDSICGDDGYFPSPGTFVYTLPNIMIGELCIRHGIKGENCVFISEGFDPGFMHFFAENLFLKNKITACVVGHADYAGDGFSLLLFLIEKRLLSGNGGIGAFNSENMKSIINEVFK